MNAFIQCRVDEGAKSDIGSRRHLAGEPQGTAHEERLYRARTTARYATRALS